MQVTRITAAGVVEGTGEVLPDRESLTLSRPGEGVCRQTGLSVCSLGDLCRECDQALSRTLAHLGPPREWSEEEIEALKARSRKGKSP